jgi:hypothetical protein
MIFSLYKAQGGEPEGIFRSCRGLPWYFPDVPDFNGDGELVRSHHFPGGRLAPQERQVVLLVGIFLSQKGHRRIFGNRLNTAIAITRAPVMTGMGADAKVRS